MSKKKLLRNYEGCSGSIGVNRCLHCGMVYADMLDSVRLLF